MKGFLLRPFDERSMTETLALSALAHAVLFFAGTIVAWLLPRYIEPFPSTRVEIVSEAELQQQLKAYRATSKTTPRQATQPQQQEQQKEEPSPSTKQRAPVQEQARAAGVSTTTKPPQPSLKTQEQTREQTQTKADDATQDETIEGLLTSLEEASDEEATLDESLDEALAGSETEASFLTSESVLTPSELQAFRRHITQCWNPPVGAPALENLVVDLLLTIDEQAYVVDALVIDRARMTSDPFFRSAAESAMRTLSDKACSPLRLPLEKHALWKKTILRFDPRSLLGN